MKRVLWLSPYAPYDDVKHAGGKIENYYVKGLNKNGNIDLTLLTFVQSDEYKQVVDDLATYKLKNIVLSENENKHLFGNKIINLKKCYNRYAGMTDCSYFLRIKHALRENNIEQLDVIIIEWTEFILFVPELRRMFPKAKIISVEEDVTFLKFYRTIKLTHNIIKEMLRWVRYKKLKKIELYCLEHSDLVILNNPKDEKLLNVNGVKNTWHWSPYFNSFVNLNMKRNSTKDILFFGAMGRYENFASCIWFIKNVMPQLDENYRFIIVGNRPDKQLLKYASNRVIITGFVEDICPYFENALCLVAPLVTGAGIKIKVLEAMSSGLTVLTNKIGIEGIPAKNKNDFLLCETEQEYVFWISELAKNQQLNMTIGNNGKEFIKNNYNYKQDMIEFVRKVELLCEETI